MSATPLSAGIGRAVDNIMGVAGQAAGVMKEIGDMGTQIGMITQMVNVVRKGGNPMQLITSFASQNPKAQMMLGNMQGKSDTEMKQYAENMARSYGTNVETVLNQLGLQMPK